VKQERKQERATAAHRCGPGCATFAGRTWPGIGMSGGFASWAEGRAAYLHHRAEVDRHRFNVGHRHPAWWMFDDAAAGWRNDPERWQDPEDLVLPGQPYYLQQGPRLRFLAASGLLRGPEAAAILARAGRDRSPRARHDARAVRDGLSMRVKEER
jgi:hypothetical protein